VAALLPFGDVLRALILLIAAAAAFPAGGLSTEADPAPDLNAVRTSAAAIDWKPSIALGEPHTNGRLVSGVRLPAQGAHFFTWDPIRKHSPNRGWRRWGTDRLIRVLLRVARQYRAGNPGAPRLTIGDLSRPRGGDFGKRFGGIGHASHQNGLDADVYYPRRDGVERAPRHVSQVDLSLAQDLVDRFVAAGAEFVFVGPSTGLRGPPRVVQALTNHDDHLHVRLRNPLPPWMRQR
jgi:murein endopeptidase